MERVKFKRNVIVLIISMFLVSAGYTMVIPFLPLYLSELGVPEEQLTLWTGLVFSSCFFVAALMGPIWGKLADTSGTKKMAVRAGILLGFSYLICGLCQNEYHLLAARAFQGFANGFVAAAMAIISVSVQSSEIGVTLGAAQTALVMGGICGPLLGGALSEFIGMRGSFFVSAAFLWIVSLAVIFFVHEPALKGEESTDREKTSIKDDISYALKNDHLRELLAILFLLQVTILMIQPVTSLWVRKLMGDSGNVELVSGFIMSSGGLAGALTTALWGKFGQSRGYYAAMFITLSFAGVITIAQSIPSSIIGFGICQFLVGCFVIGINPSLNAALVKYTPSSFRGRVFGLSNTAQQFGNMIGPILASFVSMTGSIREVYIAAGVIQLLLGFRLFFSRIKKGEY